MNHVERFRAVMNFEDTDRLPRWEWAMWWDKTIARWHQEGLPQDLIDIFEIHEYFGLDPYKQFWFSTNEPTIAAVQHHVDGGVSDMDDYERFLPHLYPDHSESIKSMASWAERQAEGEAVVWITLEGFFWFPRTLMGFVKLMYAFIEDAELIHRMNEDLLQFNLGLLDQIEKACVPVFMTIAEDMSFNNGPMIGENLFEQFVAPYYHRLLARVKEMDAQIKVIVDTDGDVTMMVPCLSRAGIGGLLPLELQAGVDGMKLREQFPDFALVGHYDKMVMPAGEAAMRAEFERLVPIMKGGGFIPSVDHQTPPGVSLDQYRIYRRLLDEYTLL
jgi:hypothetical protein